MVLLIKDWGKCCRRDSPFVNNNTLVTWLLPLTSEKVKMLELLVVNMSKGLFFIFILKESNYISSHLKYEEKSNWLFHIFPKINHNFYAW